MQNILSVDLEDWFHAEYVRKHVRNRKYRINQSVNRVLAMLNRHGRNLTFFVVGEIAERFPELVEKIFEEGHEIAYHSFHHEMLWELDSKTFRSEVERFNKIVKKITGEKCLGFRAPSCSMDNRTLWALDILEELGFIYDSSVFPMKTPLYGVPSAPIFPYRPSRSDIAKRGNDRKILEFPFLVYPIGKIRVPASGGFCFRFFPTAFIEMAIRKMNYFHKPAVLNFHPWEVNPATPRLDLGFFRSFVTYFNLDKTEKKLRHLLSDFEFVSFRDFIESERLY